MSFSVGIVGLPNVGKSTLFKALTQQQVAIAPRAFTTIDPNHGIVSIPDKRLKKIAEFIKPEKVTPTTIEFVDIAGLVKGAHKGEGLGNQFLAQIRNCDAICEIIRTFEDETIEHVEQKPNPERDIEIIKTELLMKDLETLEKVFAKLEKKKDKETQKKINVIEKIKQGVSESKTIFEISLNAEQEKEIKDLQLLTAKPIIFLLNTGPKNIELKNQPDSLLKLNLKLEQEISELSENEIKELGIQSSLPDLVSICYKTLDLITFYTVIGAKETRAWTLKKGSTVLAAAGVVHSDFQEKFKKAMVVNWKDLSAFETWKKAKDAGALQIMGKNYIVQDGDIIEFKI